MKTIVTLIGPDGRTEGTWIVPTDTGADGHGFYKTRDAIPVITNGRKLVITTIGEVGVADQTAPAPVSNMAGLKPLSFTQSFTDAVVLSTMDQLCAAQLAEEGDFEQAEAMFLHALQHLEQYQNTAQFQKVAENYARFLYDRGRLSDADNYCIKAAALYFWKKDECNGQLSFSVEDAFVSGANAEVPRSLHQELP